MVCVELLYPGGVRRRKPPTPSERAEAVARARARMRAKVRARALDNRPGVDASGSPRPFVLGADGAKRFTRPRGRAPLNRWWDPIVGRWQRDGAPEGTLRSDEDEKDDGGDDDAKTAKKASKGADSAEEDGGGEASGGEDEASDDGAAAAAAAAEAAAEAEAAVKVAAQKRRAEAAAARKRRAEAAVAKRAAVAEEEARRRAAKRPKRKFRAEAEIPQHEHPLRLFNQNYYEYICDCCETTARGVTFRCDDCGYDACPACVGLHAPGGCIERVTA